jgi:sulfite exporter TauE/SafE
MFTWMTLGFLIGLQHALEADHIAAVATIAADKSGLGRIARHGAIWGIGHALTLGAFGGTVYALKLSLDARLASGLELVVGIMLVVLGLKALDRLVRERVHFHVHCHAGGQTHFHAHSHAGDVADHRLSAHDHQHRKGQWARSLAVGMMHGLAGSAAIVVLTASSAASPTLGLAFVILFGIGSVAGMAAFSAVIAMPLTMTANTLTWANRSLQGLAGLIALGLGLRIIVESGAALLS